MRREAPGLQGDGTARLDLLRRIHGSSQHVGEVYLPATTAPFDDTQRTLAELREQLRRAVETENFELAAELRDQIRGME